MSARLELLGVLLVLLMPAAYAAAVRVALDSGIARHEPSIVAGTTSVTAVHRAAPTARAASEFEPPSRAPPLAARSVLPETAHPSAASRGAEPRALGARMDRNDTW